MRCEQRHPKVGLAVAALVADPIAQLLEPLFAAENSPQAKLGIGYGPGRGVALLFMLCGIMNVSLVTPALFYKPLRDLNGHTRRCGDVVGPLIGLSHTTRSKRGQRACELRLSEKALGLGVLSCELLMAG